MATFKVGDKVRVVRYATDEDRAYAIQRGSAKSGPGMLGDTAVVIRDPICPLLFGDYTIRLDKNGWECTVYAYMIVPITDPRASEFIADMQRFAHVAKTTKVTA